MPQIFTQYLLMSGTAVLGVSFEMSNFQPLSPGGRRVVRGIEDFLGGGGVTMEVRMGGSYQITDICIINKFKIAHILIYSVL